MRPVTLTDLTAAARVLRALPEGQREAAMAALIARADLADRMRREAGRNHPLWGNGTLAAAALAPGTRLADPAGPEYLACLALALEAVLRRPTA